MSRTGCHGCLPCFGLSACVEHVRGVSSLLGFDKDRRV